MTRNAIVDALGVLKAGRIVDLTHLVHPGIQRFGPFPAMRIETRYTVAESGFHVEQVSFVTQYGTHVDAPEHFVEGRRTLERIELEELMLPLFVLYFGRSRIHRACRRHQALGGRARRDSRR